MMDNLIAAAAFYVVTFCICMIASVMKRKKKKGLPLANVPERPAAKLPNGIRPAKPEGR